MKKIKRPTVGGYYFCEFIKKNDVFPSGLTVCHYDTKVSHTYPIEVVGINDIYRVEDFQWFTPIRIPEKLNE